MRCRCELTSNPCRLFFFSVLFLHSLTRVNSSKLHRDVHFNGCLLVSLAANPDRERSGCRRAVERTQVFLQPGSGGDPPQQLHRSRQWR